MRLRLRHISLCILLLWLIAVAVYGYLDVSSTMRELKTSPSSDLYANDLGFQVLAFVLTKGLVSIFLLGLSLWGAAYAYRSNLLLMRTRRVASAHLHVGRLKENAVAELMNTEEFVRFERRWKIIFTVFGVIFAGALMDYLMRSPHGVEAFLCYSLGAIGLLVCVWSARRLGDADRLDGAMGGLEVLGEDLPTGGIDD